DKPFMKLTLMKLARVNQFYKLISVASFVYVSFFYHFQFLMILRLYLFFSRDDSLPILIKGQMGVTRLPLLMFLLDMQFLPLQLPLICPGARLIRLFL